MLPRRSGRVALLRLRSRAARPRAGTAAGRVTRRPPGTPGERPSDYVLLTYRFHPRSGLSDRTAGRRRWSRARMGAVDEQESAQQSEGMSAARAALWLGDNRATLAWAAKHGCSSAATRFGVSEPSVHRWARRRPAGKVAGGLRDAANKPGPRTNAERAPRSAVLGG